MTDLVTLAGLVAAAAAGSAVNAVAGGGMLIAFPALVTAGFSPITANATATVALWPGSLAGARSYDAHLGSSRGWLIGFSLASLIGGAIGGLLVVLTPPSRFAAVVPWLVLVATALFLVQPLVVRHIKQHSADDHLTAMRPAAFVFQMVIAIYGGYFGAGAGVLMLAALEYAGMSDIHRMNGLKLWAGCCLNAAAILMFATNGLIDWPTGLAMAAGATIGGYLSANVAQRIPQRAIRVLVTAIGVGTALFLL